MIYSYKIYLADIQKQERIDQMLIDINKYKKIEKDLIALQEAHRELEKSSKKKLNRLTHERNDLQKSHDELQEQLDKYEYSEPTSPDIDRLQQEVIEAKEKNNLLRQRNCKILEQLNKFQSQQES